MHPRIAPLPFALLAAIGMTNAVAAYLLLSRGHDAALGVAMLVASLGTLGAAWVLAGRVAAPLARLAPPFGAAAGGERGVGMAGLGRSDAVDPLVRHRDMPPSPDTGESAADLAAMAEGIARAVDGAAGALRAAEGRIIGLTRDAHGSVEAAEAMARATRDARDSIGELRDLLDRIAAGAEADVERRASTRVPLRRGAMLELAGRRAVAVNLLDLSEGGAALEAGETGAAVGMEGALVFGTCLMPMRVVAVGQGRIHLAFTTLSAEARMAVRHMMGGAGQALAA